MNIIKLEHVEKRFNDNNLLYDINVEFQSGRIYGIIGPNGSGKSVLLQMICGLMKTTNGVVLYNDKIVTKDINVVPNCGIIINKPAFFNDLNAFKNLKLLAGLQNKIDDKKIEKAIDTVGLINDNKKVGKYSVGMLQRLGIAQAIMEDPDILILDEFTNGLDEKGIKMVHDIIKKENKKGKLIIITSHNKTDIDVLCDEVYKIDGGKLYCEE